MNPTPEQHLAITRQDRALLVEAGAGTGKTWVLVQRFLHLLDRHPDWPLSGIIAVTFTEKAAREMRNRIRRGIEERAAHAPPDSTWQERRRSLEQLAVSTIHGLCARILRENAIAAGIDPQFGVLDEQEADLLKREALTQTIATLAQEDDPALSLLSSLRTRDLESELESLFARRSTTTRLFRALPTSTGSAEAGPVPALLDRWRAGLEEMRRSVWSDLLRADPVLAQAVEHLPGLTCPDPEDKLAPSVAAAHEGLAHVSAGRFPEAIAAFARIHRTGGRQATWGGKEALAELKLQLGALQEAHKKLCKYNCHLDVDEADAHAARALQLWHHLWDKLEDTYAALKEQRQALDFDDLELLTERLLAEHSDDERLRAFRRGVRHLMVDEFQDTNEAQWAILSALAPPDAGPNPGGEDGEGRLFLVGDAKQSIYRFRQAQVSVFQRTVRHLTGLAVGSAIPLTRSFRTHAPLVAALNHLFDRILEPMGESYSDYEARPGPLIAHRPAPPGLAAPVEVVLLPKEREDGSSLSAEEARLFEADLIAERLHDLQRSDFPVWDREDGSYRPFRYDDAAVLFRATTDVPLYEERFRAAGLPYLTVSGRGYYDRPEIRDLVSLLAALHNPYDDLSLAAALRSPLFSLSDETLYRLRRRTADGRPSSRHVPLVSALAAPPPTDEPERVSHAAAVLRELWDLAGREDVCHLLRRALDRTGYQAVLALQDASEGGGGRRHANLEKLLRLAYERGGDGLSAFLRHVSLLREREVREGEAAAGAPEAGAVQLMSVHAAKGLEFPVVAVADLGRSPGGAARTRRVMGDPAYGLVCMDRNEDGDWVKPAGYAWAEWLDGRMEQAESNRVLYVACTRAADLLLLFGRPGPSDTWLARVMRAWELAPEGPPEGTVSYPGFALRVRRPVYADDDRAPRPDRSDGLGRPSGQAQVLPMQGGSPGVETPYETQPGSRRGVAPGRAPEQTRAHALPAAVAALAPRPPRSVAVTALARFLGREPEPLSPVRPRSDGVIGLDIGRLVHRALDHWDCLSEPHRALQARLEAWAARRGLDAATARRVAGAAHRCLREFWRSELYREASRSPERHTELPFALQAGQTTIRGALDLLYRADEGRWHLVDWKTDYVQEDDLLVRACEHRLQLAVYARAAAVMTGKPPAVLVCFLRPRVRVMSFQAEELTQEWEAVVRALEGLGAGAPVPPG